MTHTSKVKPPFVEVVTRLSPSGNTVGDYNRRAVWVDPYDPGCPVCRKIYRRYDDREYIYEYELLDGSWVRGCKPQHAIKGEVE